MRVLVEKCDVAGVSTMEDYIAEAVVKLGHDVIRWDRRELFPTRAADVGFVWNDNFHQRTRDAMHGTKIIHAEYGWLSDRKSCIQLDDCGVQGRASWVDEPLVFVDTGETVTTKDGPILVCLHYDGVKIDDDCIHNPYYHEDALGWLTMLSNCAASATQFIVRPHPNSWSCRNAVCRDYVNRHPRMRWDDESPLDDVLNECSAVAVIMSTAAGAALEKCMPVLSFGPQVFRKEGAVYCLDNVCIRTAAAMSELASRACSLRTSAIRAMVDKMRTKQWYPETRQTWPARMRKEFDL